MYDHYLPLILSALSILILGCWNPKPLQAVHHGQPSGHPSYMWLALISLLVGLASCYLMHMNKYGGSRLDM
jgi:hypothetical protein